MNQNGDVDPLLEINDIQGNIIPGFNKDHQCFIGLIFNDIDGAKKWINWLADHISTLAEVHNFKKVFKSMKIRLGEEPTGLVSTFTNVGFSYQGLGKLVNLDTIKDCLDEKFMSGLLLSSASLGDSGQGSSDNWIVGGPNSIPDVLLVVASDDPDALMQKVKILTDEAIQNSMKIIYQETGHDLAYYKGTDFAGHEHFGFKDGISQPGVRGKVDSTTFLTDRDEPHDPNSFDPQHDKKGNPLVATGEFILGYDVQNSNWPQQVDPHPVSPMLKNGSYLVFRRLKQDVVAFDDFAAQQSKKISKIAGFVDVTPELFKAMMVGRWPSGAPIEQTPKFDCPTIGKDPYQNNKFGFINDLNGINCPISSHIRKVNPRDTATDLGSSSFTLKHRILRRGIPFGAPLQPDSQDQINGNRGLLFVSYQTNIANQFEFLAQRWMNQVDKPANAASPSGSPSGYDLLVGQNNDGRVRSVTYVRQQDDTNSTIIEVTVTNSDQEQKDWIIPTGGGYFFSPSITTIRTVFGKFNNLK